MKVQFNKAFDYHLPNKPGQPVVSYKEGGVYTVPQAHAEAAIAAEVAVPVEEEDEATKRGRRGKTD